MSLSPGFILAILIALSVHEYAHALVAYWLGDPTAKHEGRLTLNPLAHLDPLGTVMFLLVRFGWGKPVPVDPRYFRNHRWGMAAVALAGPVSNLMLAFLTVFLAVAFSFLPLPLPLELFLQDFLQNSLFLNLGLMAFNLLPVAPLDGSKIIGIVIPWQYEARYEEFLRQGPYILLGLLIAERILGIPLIIWWITTIINPILRVMEALM